MPPNRRRTTSDATEPQVPPATPSGVSQADEAQADMPLKVDEIAHVNTPPAEPAMSPTAEQLGAASLAGLMGDIKEVRAHVEAVVASLDTVHDAHNILVERLEHAESVTDGAMVGLNERLSIQELRSDVIERELSTRGAIGDAPPAIYAAVWGVMNDVQGIGKHGQMDPASRLGNYKYRRYDDLKRELGAVCRTHGVMLQSEIMNVVNDRSFEDKRKTRVQVSMRYLFTSLVDGSTVKFEVIGESIDTSDKASGKAMTMALKSALDQTFMLAMEDIEDPDASRPGEYDPDVPIHTRGPLEGQPIRDDIPREQRRERRDAALDRREPHPTQADLAHAQRVEREYAVGDTVTVAGTTFTKHSDGPADPWDQGPPKDTRTDEEKAQAAADKVSAPGVTMKAWSAISDAARQMGLYEILVKVNGQEMALKHHLVAVGRTLA